MNFPAKILGGLVAGAALLFAATANAQEVKHYRFAHDQQLNSGYSVAYDIFSAKLKELSKGTMLVDQYPGAQLGQEPQILQLVKAGDIDFAVVSSANTSTISPQAGVMSLHFLFRNEDHITKALGDDATGQMAPMNKVGGPEDLKGVTALFASDACAFITGQTLAVDGGLTAV